jgi:hypothetical protein
MPGSSPLSSPARRSLARSGPGPEGTAKLWRVSGMLRVVRREPYPTAAGKAVPIIVVRRAAS